MNIVNLRGKIPNEVLDEISNVQSQFGITSRLRLAHFLSQTSYESGKFSTKVENLNYRADALYNTFRKYFPTIQTALKYERKPEMIGNRIYANRMGNGDEASGDGFKFRGRGFIQLTGRDNYAGFGKFIIRSLSSENVVSFPDLVSDKYPLLSAAWYWSINNLNAVADLGNDADTVAKLTKKINGGKLGLENRIKEFNQFYKLLS